MSNTYEFTDRDERLEVYEWDSVWWEHASTEGVPRVLYIGDSISRATRGFATEVATEKIYFDNVATSKALDNPYFFDTIKLFAAQQVRCDAVVINNGLHGWHLEDSKEYKQHYENMILFLREFFKDIPVMLVLTTHVADPERDKRVIERNKAVCELAEQYGLDIIDFYKPVFEHSDLITEDGVHLFDDGSKILADVLVNSVNKYINV